MRRARGLGLMLAVLATLVTGLLLWGTGPSAGSTPPQASPAAAGPAGRPAAQVATTSAASVAISHRRAVIGAGGGVHVRLRSTCPASFQAYELDVSVTQGATTGSRSRLAPLSVVVCDGRSHRSTVTVHPEQGSFRLGRARIDVFVGFFDAVSGSDTEATDTATVRLRRRT
jgi:hypothetical protein